MPDTERLIYRSILISLSILVPGIISLSRFKRMDPVFKPFIFCIWISCVNEITGIILWTKGYPVAVNNNIYVLIQAILLTAFFKNAGIFDNYRKSFYLLITGFLLFWFWENILAGKLYGVSSWFRILYSFILVLIAVTCINKLIVGDLRDNPESNNLHLLKKPVLLICTGLILFFTCKLIVEIFWLYGLGASESFRMEIYSILIYINLTVNIIYAIAILWMLPKQQYIML